MGSLWDRVVAGVGILFILGVALLMSSDRKLALKRWPLIAWGFGLQFLFAILIFKAPPIRAAFDWFNEAFIAVINCTNAGAEFVFGPLVPGGFGDFATTGYVEGSTTAAAAPGTPKPANGFFVIATMVLPTIIFFSALTSILYHLNLLQKVVLGIAWVMQKSLRTSGAETLSAAANIFVGQTEAPLVVKPFLARMTKSELMTVMTGGFATVAGGVMAAYVGMLVTAIPDIAGHLLAASIMSAPAALVIGKMMVPETEEPETAGTLTVSMEKQSVNALDAAAIGTSEGVQLALNVGGMLIAFLALVALLDLLFATAGSAIFSSPEAVPAWFNLRGILGYLFSVPAYLLGITDWNEALRVGQLLGMKMAANEFVAYLDLASIMGGDSPLSQRTATIASYALCGFANLGSIGIQIGGLSVIAPSRRADLSRLAFRAMIAGTLAANATACVAGVLL